MKYLLKIFESKFVTDFYVTITSDDIVFTTFPTEIGNPNYDAFLEQADLTDEEVHALPVDEWIEL